MGEKNKKNRFKKTEQNKDATLTKEQKDILELEKNYYKILEDLFKSEEFLLDLKKIEQSISVDYDRLTKHWHVKNKIKIAWERLIRYYVYTKLAVGGTFYSPLSSDIAFYTADALINIDAKTTDLHGNSGDDDWVCVERNQISFNNKVLNATGDFTGVHYDSLLPSFDLQEGLPVLTFFLRLTYTDDYLTFKLNHITLDCIPNGELSNLFCCDIINNFKTYHYMGEKQAKKLELVDLIPRKHKEEHWEELKIGRITYYYDKKVKNPNYPDDNIIWGKTDKKYKTMISGHTARINPQTIKNRYDSRRQLWYGHSRWDIDETLITE